MILESNGIKTKSWNRINPYQKNKTKHKKVKNEFWIISIKDLNDKRPSKKNIINMIILKVA